MSSKRYLPVAVLLAVGLLAFFLVEQNDDTDRVAQLPTDSSSAALGSISNPLLVQRQEVLAGDLAGSFDCVDANGLFECGEFAGGEVLYYAALIGSKERIREFSQPSILERQGNTALNVVAAIGDLELVKYIHELNLSQTAYQKPSADEHAIVPATTFGHADVVKFFVDQGFDINEKFSDGYTDVFVEALMNRQKDVISYLLSSGYELDCLMRFPNGRTLKDVAAIQGLIDLVDMIDKRCL